MDEPVLSGKIMYLSQYAVINAIVSVESTSLGNSLVDAPGEPIDDLLETECLPNFTTSKLHAKQKSKRSKNA